MQDTISIDTKRKNILEIKLNNKDFFKQKRFVQMPAVRFVKNRNYEEEEYQDIYESCSDAHLRLSQAWSTTFSV